MFGFSAAGLRSLVVPLGGLIDRLDLRTQRVSRVGEVALVLLNVMQDLQLHRGLSCAVLDGQGEFCDEREATALKLQRTLQALRDQYGERHPVFARAEWTRILDGWASLQHDWRALDFHSNLGAHSELVLGVVGILKFLAADNAPLLGSERMAVIAAWPAMVEHLGMLRALGLHRLNGSDIDDPQMTTSMVTHFHAANRTLGSAARYAHGEEIVAASQALLGRVGTLLGSECEGEGEPAFDGPTYLTATTVIIDHWYGLIRRRILH